jgi:hypothetical protein
MTSSALLSTARLPANSWVPPRRLIHASTMADVVRVAMTVTVPNQEAMREA